MLCLKGNIPKEKDVLKKNRECQYIWEISKVHFKGVIYLFLAEFVFILLPYEGEKCEGLESEEKREKKKRKRDKCL